MLGSRRFHVATEEEIRSGRVTDVYFVRAEEALAARDADRVVVGEARAGASRTVGRGPSCAASRNC